MANNRINIDLSSVIALLILVGGGYFAKQEYDKYKQREAVAAEKARQDSEKRRQETEAQRAAADERRAEREARLEQERLAQQRAAIEKEEAERKRNSSVTEPEPEAQPRVVTLSDAELELARQAHERGVQLLRDSELKPQLVVDAAKEFTAAAELYDRGGSEKDAAETNSFLYWCKEEMSSEIARAFIKTDGITPSVAKRLDEAIKEVPKEEARAYFKRADDYSNFYPHEYMLSAIRYYEVATRFKGTPAGVVAQDRCMRAMKLAANERRPANAPAAPEPPAHFSVKLTEAEVAIAEQRLTIENAAELPIGRPFRKYVSVFYETSAKIREQEGALKVSSMVTVRDASGQTSQQFNKELYNKQHANVVKSYQPTLDQYWKIFETHRDAFLATYRAAAQKKPSPESRRALQLATEICEKEYKKMH